MGLFIPKTAVAIALTGFWLWLALSIIWSQVFFVSVINFWWLGCMPAVFWLYTLSSDRDRLWRYSSILVLGFGLCLASVAIYQLIVLHEDPLSFFLNINSHAALLNLIALPTAGYFLVAAEDRRRQLTVALGAALFILVFALAITQGRGAALSFFISLAVLLIITWKQRARSKIAILIGIIAAAFLLADILRQGGVLDRLESVGAPGAAGAARFLIWQQAWELLKASPWWGTGIGTFSVFFQPYRHPLDTSAGYYAHNDYLQIWIEAGLPGLLLLLAVYAAVLWMFIRAQKNVNGPASVKIEMAALCAGLLAIAMHSFFDFNLYTISILLLAGLALARLHSLQTIKPRFWIFRPSGILGARAYRLIVVLLSLFPLIYFLSLGLYEYEYRKGLRQANEGKLLEADASFARAQRLAPSAANVRLTRADLYRHLLADVAMDAGRRKAVFTGARELLQEAENLNPFESQVFLVRAELYRQNPRQAGGDAREQAERNFQQALKNNPRLYTARLAYAQFLLQQKDPRGAHRLLEEGIDYWYYPSQAIIPYYALAAKLRYQMGEAGKGKDLQTKMEEILVAHGWTRVAPKPSNTTLRREAVAPVH